MNRVESSAERRFCSDVFQWRSQVALLGSSEHLHVGACEQLARERQRLCHLWLDRLLGRLDHDRWGSLRQLEGGLHKLGLGRSADFGDTAQEDQVARMRLALGETIESDAVALLRKVASLTFGSQVCIGAEIRAVADVARFVNQQRKAADKSRALKCR